MADVKGVFVTFEHDISEESAQHIINAISMIRNVADVEASKVDFNDHSARIRARTEIREKVWELYNYVRNKNW